MYWEKRRHNNDIAKRSRERRRMNDMVFAKFKIEAFFIVKCMN